MGMVLAVILGPDEIANDLVAIKDLRSGQQQTVSENDFFNAVKQMLASHIAS